MSRLKKLLARFDGGTEGKRHSQQERFLLEVAENIFRLMKAQKVTQKELAKRLGKTQGHVSQILGGDRNLTLRTLSDLFFALERSAHVSYGPLGDTFEWVDENADHIDVSNVIHLSEHCLGCHTLTPGEDDDGGQQGAVWTAWQTGEMPVIIDWPGTPDGESPDQGEGIA